jgi:hypothetical protein
MRPLGCVWIVFAIVSSVGRASADDECGDSPPTFSRGAYRESVQPLPFLLPCEPIPIAMPDDSAYGARPSPLDVTFWDIRQCDYTCPDSGFDWRCQPCTKWKGWKGKTTRFQLREFISRDRPSTAGTYDCFDHAGASLIWGNLEARCASPTPALWGDFCPTNASAHPRAACVGGACDANAKNAGAHCATGADCIPLCQCNAQITEGIGAVRSCQAASIPPTGINRCVDECTCQPRIACVGPAESAPPEEWDCGCVPDGCGGTLSCFTGPATCAGEGCQGAGDGASWTCDTSATSPTRNHCVCKNIPKPCPPRVSRHFYDGCHWVDCK